MATCQYLNDYNNMYWLMVHVHQIGTYVTQLLEYESNKCNELLKYESDKCNMLQKCTCEIQKSQWGYISTILHICNRYRSTHSYRSTIFRLYKYQVQIFLVHKYPINIVVVVIIIICIFE